ncbi:MAG TPA: hypothetical protein VM713_00160 [Steroidobacteraceae bacterium]|nr:hypothetical protein [Steroidobacteraceae bacterium]
MLDDRDALLVREFAKSQRPLADAQFVAQVTERLHVYSVRRLLGVVLSGVIRAVGAGLSFGVVAPLRMRHAGLAALAALGIVLWNLVSRSL